MFHHQEHSHHHQAAEEEGERKIGLLKHHTSDLQLCRLLVSEGWNAHQWYIESQHLDGRLHERQQPLRFSHVPLQVGVENLI